MRSLGIPSFLVLLTAAVTTTCSAQTAEDIIAKNVQAVGGKDLVASTKSVVLTSTLKAMGSNFPFTTTTVAGKAFKSETDIQGAKVIQCVTDHGAWTLNQMVGTKRPMSLPDEAAKLAKNQLNIVPLANYTADGGKVKLLGKDSADYKVALVNADGFAAIYYINLKTYLIDKADVRLSVQGQEGDLKMVFTDYRKIDNGLMIPFQVESDLPQYSLNVTTEKAEVNKDIDPAIFEMPE